MIKKRNNEDTIEDPAQEGLRGERSTEELPPLPLADFSTPPTRRHDQSFDEVPEQVAELHLPMRIASEDDIDDFPDVEVVEEGTAVVAETEFVGAAPPTEVAEEDDAPTVYGERLEIPALPPRTHDHEDDSPEIVAPDTHQESLLPSTIMLPPPPPESEEDEPDHEPEWWEMVEALVELVAEMEEEAEEFDHLHSDQAKTCRLVVNRLTSILARNGVTVIGSLEAGATEDCVGQPFDRSRHQPVGLDGSDEESVVQDVTRSGFVVGSRVLRRARVRLKAMA